MLVVVPKKKHAAQRVMLGSRRGWLFRGRDELAPDRGDRRSSVAGGEGDTWEERGQRGGRADAEGLERKETTAGGARGACGVLAGVLAGCLRGAASVM